MHEYIFWKKCSDFENGNEVQEITHWDDWARNKYFIQDEYLRNGTISILPKYKFDNMVETNEIKPRYVEYYAINNRLDIIWALDNQGIHWFYRRGNFNMLVNETIVSAISKDDELKDVILKNPTRKELSDNNINQCRIGPVGNDFYFWDEGELTHPEVMLNNNLEFDYWGLFYDNKTNTFYVRNDDSDLDDDVDGLREMLDNYPYIKKTFGNYNLICINVENPFD